MSLCEDESALLCTVQHLLAVAKHDNAASRTGFRQGLHPCCINAPPSAQTLARASLVVKQDLVGVWNVEVLGVSGLHTS